MFSTLLERLLAPAPARLPEPEAHLALAALLVRVARTDGLYSAEEVEKIDRVLMQNYRLDPFAAANLRTEAEAMEEIAPDTVRFTRALKQATEDTARESLLEAMWAVALSDGLRDDQEDRLLRLVANLLGLTDVQNALARQRAQGQ